MNLNSYIFSFILFGTYIAIMTYNYEKVPFSDYMGGIIDKHNLLDTTQQPRIIFAGGSNLAFGLNSKLIHDSIGYNVVNMGLHAGLGIDFIINELKSGIKTNDIIIFTIELEMTDKGNVKTQEEAAKYYPKANNLFNRECFYRKSKYYFNQEITYNLKKLLKKKTLKPKTLDTNDIYIRTGFNKYGDLISHLTKSPKEKLFTKTGIKYEYWKGINLLNKFYKYATDKNITVYFMHAVFSISSYKKNKKVIELHEKDVKDNLKIKILNSFEDFVLHDSLFFDSRYHLNKNGRVIRTHKLIKILKRNKIHL